MLHLRGLDTVRIASVKGHADEDVVLDGRVREIDRLGNNAADEAADFGRRRVGNAVIDARRKLSVGVGILSFLIFKGSSLPFLEMLLTMMGVVALLLILWFGPLVRRLVHAVRDRAILPGLPDIWDSGWINVPASAMGADDVAHWPFSTGLLVKWVSFSEVSVHLLVV